MAGEGNFPRAAFAGVKSPDPVVLEKAQYQPEFKHKIWEYVDSRVNPYTVRIGREMAGYGLGEASVVASGYTASGGSVARLGVLGPTRMDYSNNMAAVRAVARFLSRLLGEDTQ